MEQEINIEIQYKDKEIEAIEQLSDEQLLLIIEADNEIAKITFEDKTEFHFHKTVAKEILEERYKNNEQNKI